MFRFLFGGRKSKDAVPDTDRERFKRLVQELNDMIEMLPAKPRVTFDPETGFILPEMPEQFADEALALPAPAPAKTPEPAKAESVAVDAEAETPAKSTKPAANPAVTAGDAVAATSKAAMPPEASAPQPSAARAGDNTSA